MYFIEYAAQLLPISMLTVISSHSMDTHMRIVQQHQQQYAALRSTHNDINTLSFLYFRSLRGSHTRYMTFIYIHVCILLNKYDYSNIRHVPGAGNTAAIST